MASDRGQMLSTGWVFFSIWLCSTLLVGVNMCIKDLHTLCPPHLFIHMPLLQSSWYLIYPSFFSPLRLCQATAYEFIHILIVSHFFFHTRKMTIQNSSHGEDFFLTTVFQDALWISCIVAILLFTCTHVQTFISMNQAQAFSSALSWSYGIIWGHMAIDVHLGMSLVQQWWMMWSFDPLII